MASLVRGRRKSSCKCTNTLPPRYLDSYNIRVRLHSLQRSCSCSWCNRCRPPTTDLCRCRCRSPAPRRHALAPGPLETPPRLCAFTARLSLPASEASAAEGAAAAAPEDAVVQAQVNINEVTRSCDISPLDLSIADRVRLCHDRDGHPSKNKHRQIFLARQGRGFPPNFLALLDHFKCETCAVTAGARQYRQSKRVKERGYHKGKQSVESKSTQACAQKAESAQTGDSACACCSYTGTDAAVAQVTCFANAVRNVAARASSSAPVRASGTLGADGTTSSASRRYAPGLPASWHQARPHFTAQLPAG